MITAFGGGGGAFGGDSLGRGGGSGSGSTGDGGRSARWLRCDGDSPNLDGIHDASGSSSWACSGGLLGEEARGGRSRSRALSLACATAVERERPSTNALLPGELLLPRPLGESQLISTIRASEQHRQRRRAATVSPSGGDSADVCPGNAMSVSFFVCMPVPLGNLSDNSTPRIFTPDRAACLAGQRD